MSFDLFGSHNFHFQSTYGSGHTFLCDLALPPHTSNLKDNLLFFISKEEKFYGWDLTILNSLQF